MAIKTSTFGRVELSGKDAARFIKHMHEDKASSEAKASLERGRQVLGQLQAYSRSRSK